MKKDVHPKYQKVLFVDSASGYRFTCGTTLQAQATEEFEGKSYPVSYLSISSSSHPLFTGSNQLVDSGGRVDKFRKRFERKPPVPPKEEELEASPQPVKTKTTKAKKR
jgi:large subunit ribosomal protein L31